MRLKTILRLLKKKKFYYYVSVSLFLIIVTLYSSLLSLSLILGLFIIWVINGSMHLDYPVEVNEKVLQNPLYYYIKSETLFTNNLLEDSNGVVCNNYGGRIGKQYNPSYIAWYGLLNLQKYVDTEDCIYLEKFKSQIKWLKSNYKDWGEKGYVWTYDFDWQEGKAFLKAPWISAMSQGLVISALIRHYRMFNDLESIEIAKKAVEVFKIDVADGGVRTIENGCVMYEEYPVYPLARVLDGSILGLLGLYDLWRASDDQNIKKLFEEGVKGLATNLEYWNFRDMWSWYGSHRYLCSPQYNKLNIILLETLFKLTSNKRFHSMNRKWNPTKKSLKNKIIIFILFKITTKKAYLMKLIRE